MSGFDLDLVALRMTHDYEYARVAIWPFFGPFLTNVAIFESHFLEIIYLAIS